MVYRPMAITGCQQFYNFDNFWLANSFIPKTPSDYSNKNYFGSIRYKSVTSNVSNGSRSPGSKNITTCDQEDPQLYIKAISAEESRRVNASDFRSTRTEQVHKNKTLSADLTCHGTRFSPTRRLDGKIGHFSGIFPRPYSGITSNLFKNQLSRSAFPDDVLTIWPSFSATPFLFFNMLGRGDSACKGLSGSNIFRRLPSGPSRPNQVKSSGCGSRETLGKPGLENKLPEIYSDTVSRSRISGHSLANGNKHNVFTGKESSLSQQHVGSDLKANVYQPTSVTKPSWSTELCQFCHSTRKTTLPPLSEVCTMLQPEKTTSHTTHPQTCTKRDGLVARSHTPLSTDPQEACYPFPCNGRFGSGMGCATRRNISVRRLDSPTKEMAQQQKRIVRSNRSITKEGISFKKHSCTDSIRQSNLDCIYSEGRRHKVDGATDSNISTVTPNRQIQHNSIGILPPGKIQLNSRQVVTREKTRGVAPSAPSDFGSVPKVGPPRNRFVRIATNSRSAELRINRLQRSISKLCRRLQQTMEVPPSMGVPTPQHPSQGTDSFKQCQRNIFNSGTRMASGILATRPEISITRSPIRDSESVAVVDRHDNITTSTTSADINLESLENWGWGSQIKEWSIKEKELLKNSWRQSTLSTYLPAIRRWLTWCSSSKINPESPQPADVAKFLINLFLNEKLSYSTILVHKSAVLTYCGPHVEQKSFSNFIIKHALKAIGVAKPKIVKTLFTWDPTVVLNWLSSNTPEESPFELARRTATLLLLASGRRVHDLTLLRISNDSFIDNDENIFLLPAFGSKTDTHSRRQSAWMLSKHENINICPVTLMRRYISKMMARRSESKDLNNLFITVRGNVKAASRTVIGNWVRTVLKDSGIEASPGSCRSAVASLGWLDNQPIDNILTRGNWKSPNTFFNHYCRMIELPKNNQNDFFNTFTPS